MRPPPRPANRAASCGRPANEKPVRHHRVSGQRAHVRLPDVDRRTRGAQPLGQHRLEGRLVARRVADRVRDRVEPHQRPHELDQVALAPRDLGAHLPLRRRHRPAWWTIGHAAAGIMAGCPRPARRSSAPSRATRCAARRWPTSRPRRPSSAPRRRPRGARRRWSRRRSSSRGRARRIELAGDVVLVLDDGLVVAVAEVYRGRARRLRPPVASRSRHRHRARGVVDGAGRRTRVSRRRPDRQRRRHDAPSRCCGASAAPRATRRGSSTYPLTGTRAGAAAPAARHRPPPARSPARSARCST